MPRKPKPKPGAYEKTREPGIYRRNGVYVVRVYNPETKKRDDYTAYSFEQAKEIKAEAKQAKRVQKRTGKILTVREFAGEDGTWWTLPRKKPWKPSTRVYYAERVAWFVRDFGDRMLSSITALEANQWAAENPGRVPVVKVMFSDAKRVELIHSNPYEKIQLSPSRGRQDIVVLKDSEIERLKQIAVRFWGDYARDVLCPMIDVAAGLGCRPGELFAIERADIDFRQGEVHIWRQWNGRTREFAPVKNSQLNRRVVMLPRAQKALKGMKFPDPQPGRDVNPIWQTIRGANFKERELRYFWPRIRDEFVSQLPPNHHLQRRAREEVPGGPLDFYELRHHFGTELAKLGATPYEIAQQMGHTDNGKTAMKHYIHLHEDDAVASVKARLKRAA